LVIREDLRDLTRIREIGLIEAMVEMLPPKVGAPLSLNAIREDLGVAFNTVSAWIQTLRRLYYLFEVRPYAGRLSRALRREAKIYLFDPTVIEDPGARFENIVALHLAKLRDAWNDWGYGDFSLHYLRNKEKKEVDFVITRDQKPYVLIEAKLSDWDLARSLLYFQERLRPRYAFQVVRQAAPDSLARHSSGAFAISAARLLSRLV